MSGGVLQLVAYGADDLYLIADPQITFFKVVYRRHTNFSKEQIQQDFLDPPNFGKKTTCIISKGHGDLISEIFLVVKLPKVNSFTNSLTKFAWVKRVGFSMIKSIEIEINGRVIDKHYGQWLNIWAELTGEINGFHERGMRKMVGDIEELTNFTNGKDEYTLYIPFKFWFCRNIGSSLPLVSMQYCDIKINVEFEDAERCYTLSPTHYIKCRNDIVNYKPNEYIEQNIDGEIRAGVFVKYDIMTKRLYYRKITKEKLIGATLPSYVNPNNNSEVTTYLNSQNGLKYSIVGKTSGYSSFSEPNINSQTYPTPKIRLNIPECFLLIDYFFLDKDERFKFSTSKHDYLIEQLFLTPAVKLTTADCSVKIISDHPCKLMVWTVQMEYIENSRDYYNYTSTYDSNAQSERPEECQLIQSEAILMNGNPRVSMRNSAYFTNVQFYQYTKHTPSAGTHMFSFATSPLATYPTGTCNTSQIENLEINMQLASCVDINNPAIFKEYSLGYNVFRVSGGYSGIVFIK